MKKLFKEWWPLLLIAGVWLWMKLRRKPGKEHTDETEDEQPIEIDWQHQEPFNVGACVYGSPTIYQ